MTVYHMSSFFQDRVPFAVVGSNTVVDSGGRKVRGRVYPWGVVEGTGLLVLFSFKNSGHHISLIYLSNAIPERSKCNVFQLLGLVSKTVIISRKPVSLTFQLKI